MKKKFIVIAAVFFLATNSCKKETTANYDAILTGFDSRKCICCGGLMITFNGETRPYIGDFKLIDNIAALGISENDKFPIYAKVEWKEDTTNVCNHIIITKFERKQ